MHPGDVRKLDAVDVPALHHIKDCIVFPSKGKRPHPDEMAGSDMDGDEYVVMWYDDLVFPDKNVSPMDYPPNPEEKHPGPIQ
ncbi:RNA-dependent RNA polymerase 1, partial [Araneus ventricosus]